MDAIGYASLSDDIGADEDFGLAVQDELIRRAAAERGWDLTETFRDAGVGDVTTLADRIGLASALAAVRDGRAQGIVISRFDRLGSDLVLQEQILAEARRAGATVCSATPGEDDDPSESRLLVRRTLTAIPAHASAMRDLWVRYRVMRAPPMPGDREQAALSRIEELTEHGASVEDIAATLNGEGFSPHFSRVWNRAGLRRIVERMRARRSA